MMRSLSAVEDFFEDQDVESLWLLYHAGNLSVSTLMEEV